MSDLASLAQILLSLLFVTLPFVALVRLVGGADEMADMHERWAFRQQDLEPALFASLAN